MPIQMCPIDIPQGYEFARWGRLKGGENGPYIERSGGQLKVWGNDDDSSGHYIILRRIQPVPKYIPFTSETFRPHRDRWVKNKKSQRESKIDAFDPADNDVFVHDRWLDFEEALDQLEFINADGTTEPFGQKVEGQHDQDNAE